MDTPQWPQGIGVVRPVENSRSVEKKPRPQREQAFNCPRCNSTNTKFCYYNNYSLSQPRYLCKTCRRYWTEGGTLRNVPVGGGTRKKQKSSSSCSSSINSYASSSKKVMLPDLSPPEFSPQNPKTGYGQDLNLAYYRSPIYDGVSELVALPFAFEPQNTNFSSTGSSSHLPFMELSKTARDINSGGLSSLISTPVYNPSPVFSSSFPMHEFNPSFSFSLDQNGHGNLQSAIQDHTTSSSIIGFPFEETQAVSKGEFKLDRELQSDANEWNGMFYGGSW